MRNLVLYLLVCVLLGVSCVSKRKFVSLENQNTQLELDKVSLSSQLSQTNVKVTQLEGKVMQQRDEMIKQNALTNELLNEKIKLQNIIRELDKRINSVTSEAEQTQKQLNNQLRSEIEALEVIEQKLELIKDIHSGNIKKLETVSANLYDLIVKTGDDKAEMEMEKDHLKLILYHSFIFGSTLRIQTKASGFLKDLSAELANYPELAVAVESHTDNTRINATSKYQDALELTAYRAAIMTRWLIQEGGLNGSQLSSIGKAGYFPRVSNETAAGRAFNNRIELLIQPDWGRLLDQIREE